MSDRRRSRSGAPPTRTLTRHTRALPAMSTPATSRPWVGVSNGTAGLEALARRDLAGERRVVEPPVRVDRAVVRRNAEAVGAAQAIISALLVPSPARTEGRMRPRDVALDS